MLLVAAKPKIDCEKKFTDVRFLMKCIELNFWKASLSDEKLCIKVVEELHETLNTEEKELLVIEKEISTLKELRQEQKRIWIDLYHDLIKIIGLKHKFKGYFKQVFKRKYFEKGERQPRQRHSSSEGSECAQSIDSNDDNQAVNLSEVDDDMLKKVFDLSLRRQEVENQMKALKRKIRPVTVRQNVVHRKIQKFSDALNEIYEKLNIILESRKRMFETLKWPFILYPSNIHSDYIKNLVANPLGEKQFVELEMERINDLVIKKLKHINNYVKLSILFLTSRVAATEVQDMIDVVTVLLSTVQSVSISTDAYFRRMFKSLESVKKDEVTTDEKDHHHYISDILEKVKEPVDASDIGIRSVSLEEPSDILIQTSSESVDSLRGAEKEPILFFNLQELEREVSEVIKSEEWHSWIEVYEDIDVLGLADKSHLVDQNIDEVVSSAIPHKTSNKLSVEDCTSEPDYYMCPFEHDTTEEVKEQICDLQSDVAPLKKKSLKEKIPRKSCTIQLFGMEVFC
ncbi:uncharacterized protein CEXT_724711 [Caerostris extrusa]|uniref:Uncharacterized protein n=1 Tax=Caerostris extrusa TaxID=172846 RepID=A0AAV4QNR0_CAEEX|nr:uncharacterized protein CEXT_724711 [Caerostris extrusa]